MILTLVHELKQIIRTKLCGSQKDTCRAITANGTLCGKPKFGQNSSGEIVYCEEHVPNGASPGLVRVEPVKFKSQSGEVLVPGNLKR